jgi:CDP-glucose 4,6-dehydratase
MKILITGHTGFKGSWMSVLLKELGHEVSGFSLPPRPTSLYQLGQFAKIFSTNHFGDLREQQTIREALDSSDPDVIFHLGAQPLVRYSYLNPVETFQTNVQGTLNLLEASTPWLTDGARMVVVTTDKVYKDLGAGISYDETSALGGYDPYSASKAMADILTQSWISTNPTQKLAIARAGNVIGGGDDSAERLLPDLINAFQNNKLPTLRNPNAVRPWQHVLDCVNGYWSLANSLEESANRGAWNFGPEPQSFATVSELTELVGEQYGIPSSWKLQDGDQPHETQHLTLNSEKSKTKLKWRNILNLDDAVTQTTTWHKNVFNGADALVETTKQVQSFISRSNET